MYFYTNKFYLNHQLYIFLCKPSVNHVSNECKTIESWQFFLLLFFNHLWQTKIITIWFSNQDPSWELFIDQLISILSKKNSKTNMSEQIFGKLATINYTKEFILKWATKTWLWKYMRTHKALIHYMLIDKLILIHSV